MPAKQRMKEERRRLLEEASKDSAYLAELEELEHDFAHADAEAWRTIDELEGDGPEKEWWRV